MCSSSCEVGPPHLTDFVSPLASSTTDVGTDPSLTIVGDVEFTGLLLLGCVRLLSADDECIGISDSDFFFRWFYQHLKVLKAFVSNAFKSGRFFVTLLAGDTSRPMETAWRKKHKKSCWNEVHNFCRELQPKLEVLFGARNAEKFLHDWVNCQVVGSHG